MHQTIALPQLRYTVRTRTAVENSRTAARQHLLHEYHELKNELAEKMRGANPVKLVREQRNGEL